MKNWLNINSSYKKKLYLLVIAAIFILGIYLRLRIYLYNRPLWFDECQLVLSILDRNIFGFFLPLDYLQSAPPLFMMSVKLFSLAFGIKEFVLRMFPFLCALLAIPIFYKFAKLFLVRKWSILLASFLFAVNRELIYYSQELKQYSSDVLFFLLAFLILNKLSIKKLSITEIILYSIGIYYFRYFLFPPVLLSAAGLSEKLLLINLKTSKNL